MILAYYNPKAQFCAGFLLSTLFPKEAIDIIELLFALKDLQDEFIFLFYFGCIKNHN